MGLSGWAGHHHRDPYNRGEVGDRTVEAKGWSDLRKGSLAKECCRPPEV